METTYLIAAFAFFVTALIQGLLALAVLSKSVKREADWVFFFTMAACAYWSLSNALASSLGTILERPQNALGHFLFQTSYPVLYTVPPAIRHCVLSGFGIGGWRRWGSVTLNYLGVVPFILLFWTSFLTSQNLEGHIVGVLFLVYVSLSFIEVTRKKEMWTGYAKERGTRMVLWSCLGSAVLLPILSSFLCGLFPGKALQISLIPKMGALPVTLAIAYVVLRYRFMDMVLKRSLLYSLLSGLLLGLYLLGVKYGAEWLSPQGGLYSVALEFIVILLLLFAFQPLKERLQRSIDRFFFRRHLESSEVLRDFSQTLTTWSDLAGLCPSFVEKVTESLGLSSGAILFADGTVYNNTVYNNRDSLPLASVRPFLQQTDSPVVVEELAEGPLKLACLGVGIGLVLALPCREQPGWLVLGEKRSGEPFLSQEIALIEAVCGQLATAIDNLCLMQAKVALEREVQHQEKLAAIGQLSATLAHEIRNPITGAKCLLQQVGEGMNGAPEGKEYVQLALADLERVEQSVSQLLTFARKEEYGFTEQNVSELVGSTINGFTAQAQEKGVTVQLQDGAPNGTPNGTPVWAAVDGEKIHRTLLNLLTNALDAVEEGGSIVVSLYAKGPEVEIHINDNGLGLTIEDQRRIFEPFFTRKEKGTGLGLAIAKKIVEGHGGHITVASMPGQGATFTLVFPRQRPDARAAA